MNCFLIVHLSIYYTKKQLELIVALPWHQGSQHSAVSR
jgi:hypothetical protein